MKTLKAYKVFDENWKCKGFQYEVGKTYSMKEEPILCERGFHACKKVADCFTYQSFDPKNKVAEVRLLGVIVEEDGDKQATNKIKIIKEISWNEMLDMANTGLGNSGYSNSGDSNSGDSNSGNSNSGDSNSGYRNSGNRNSGNRNSGNRNSGYSNSGDSNSGNRNSGDSNSGDRNSGDFNSTTPDTIRTFNKECDRQLWDNAIKPNFIYNVEINIWEAWDDMTDQEKIDNKNTFVTNGYLKTIPYKKAWANAFKNATKEDIKLLKALPNFDAIVFEEITGIIIK
jgi:hypothetical protein